LKDPFGSSIDQHLATRRYRINNYYYYYYYFQTQIQPPCMFPTNNYSVFRQCLAVFSLTTVHRQSAVT